MRTSAVSLLLSLFIISNGFAEGKKPEKKPDLIHANACAIALGEGTLAHTRAMEAEAILHTIQTNYGPILLKGKTVGLDWSATLQKYKSEFARAKNTVAFYQIAARLHGELQDAHVSVTLPTDFRMDLPIQFYYAEGQTFVSGVFPFINLDDDEEPIEIGDILISVDGKSPQEIRDTLAPVAGMGNESSDAAYLSLLIGRRALERGLPMEIVSKKKSVIRLRHMDGHEFEREIDWQISGEEIISRNYEPDARDEISPLRRGLDQPLIQKRPPVETHLRFVRRLTEAQPIRNQLLHLLELQDKLAHTNIEATLDLPTTREFPEAPEAPKGMVTIGHPEPSFQLPKNFRPLNHHRLLKPLLEPVVGMTGFHVGTYRRNGKRVGFIRIPSYVPPMPELALFGLRYVIAKLEKETDYLIVDQEDNGGGYVFFSDWIVKALGGGQINDEVHMRFEVRPTQAFLDTFRQLKNAFQSGKLPPEMTDKYLSMIQEDYDRVDRAFRNGDDLSEPIRLYVMSEMLEHMISSALDDVFKEGIPVMRILIKMILRLTGIDIGSTQAYTKPVYFMINELDFSGGDATPANLQDYGMEPENQGRIRLVGTNTAGAGGSVGAYSYAVLNSMETRLTESLMTRVRHEEHHRRYVENYGVDPDLAFSRTLQDYRNEGRTFFARINELVENDLKENKNW